MIVVKRRVLEKPFSFFLILLLLLSSIPLLPIRATELFSDGFETGNFNAWTGTDDIEDYMTVQSTIKHHGTYAAKWTAIPTLTDNNFVYETISAQSPVCIRDYFRFSTLPDADTDHVTIIAAGLTSSWFPATVQVRHDGTDVHFYVRNGYYGGVAWGTTIVEVDKWYCVELKAQTSGGTLLYIDGSLEATAQYGIAQNIDVVRIGSVHDGNSDGVTGFTYTGYADCAVISSSYIGPEPGVDNYTLTIQAPSGSGSTNVTTGSHVYPSGTAVKVLASPSAGWSLHHWVLDSVNSGSVNPKTVTMNDNHTLQAVFTYTAWQGKVSGVSYVDIAKIMGVPYANIGTVGWQNTRYSNTYTDNAVWIVNEDWVAMNPSILTNDLSGVVEKLKNNNIKYAFISAGRFTQPATINYLQTDAYYQNVIDALHVEGIKAIAWIGASEAIDITAANSGNLYTAILDCMSRCTWDGYNDDIEIYTGTLSEWISYINGLTPILNNINKLNMPNIPLDWEQNINQYLIVDYIVTMFYGGTSTLESSSANLFWQENFGQYGQNTPPASPLILGIMNYYGNQYPLAWQLGKAGEFHDLYGHPQLCGFSIWLYEYMGTSFDDWNQWSFWIDQIGEVTPTLYEVSMSTSPAMSSVVSFNGTEHTVPYTYYTFGGPIVVAAQENVNVETHSVAFGDTDHNGSPMGYTAFTYACGPYNLTSPVEINATYVYCRENGNIKVAIYNATEYEITGWGGTDWHPDHLLNQSVATSCIENTWNLIALPNTTLSTGIYFIVIKLNTNLMLGGSGNPPEQIGGEIYGYNQWITQSYSAAFSDIFPQPEGAMQYEGSAYLPTAPIVLIPYEFDHWENSSTNPIRTIDVTSNLDLIAYYEETP
jgi:hypothetical protein